MRLMNVSISNVNGSRTKGTPMSVPLYQIANFVRTLVFVYQDVVSRDMENAWRSFTFHLKDILYPAELKRKTLGRQIDSFRIIFGGHRTVQTIVLVYKIKAIHVTRTQFSDIVYERFICECYFVYQFIRFEKKFSGSAAGSVNAKDIFDAHFQSSTLYSRRHYQ